MADDELDPTVDAHLDKTMLEMVSDEAEKILAITKAMLERHKQALAILEEEMVFADTAIGLLLRTDPNEMMRVIEMWRGRTDLLRKLSEVLGGPAL